MFKTVIALAMAVFLSLGSISGLAYAAQDSLPGEALYPVMILAEDAQIALASGPQAKLQALHEFTNRRTFEMGALHKQGQPVPVEVGARLQAQTRLAVQLAAGLDEAGMHQALEQIRERIQTQVRQMAQSQQPEDPVMAQTRTRLQEQLRLVEEGLAEPQQLRQQMQIQVRERQGTPAQTGQARPPATSSGNGNPTPNSTPGGNAYGQPGPHATPMPGGEGNPSCTPGAGGAGSSQGGPGEGNGERGGPTDSHGSNNGNGEQGGAGGEQGGSGGSPGEGGGNGEQGGSGGGGGNGEQGGGGNNGGQGGGGGGGNP